MSFTLLTKHPEKRSIRKRFPVLLPILVIIGLLFGYILVSRIAITPLIGVVQIDGVIIESEAVIKRLKVMEANPAVKGIVVRINSQGGAVAPSQEIYSELIRLRHIKPVYVSISSIAASGGYYIAVGANKIFANPGSLTGSIGVIMQSVNVEKLMNRFGVSVQTIKSGSNKDIGSAFREMSEEEHKLLNTVIDDTHQQFIAAVTENRTIDPLLLKTITDGRFFTGRQALAYGLIDELGGFRDVVNLLRKDLNLGENTQLYFPMELEKSLLSLLSLNNLVQFKKPYTQAGLFYLSLTQGL